MALNRRTRFATISALILVCVLALGFVGSSMTLQEAIDDPDIVVVIESKGLVSGDSFRIYVKNNSGDTIEIDIRPGDVLVPRDNGTQRFEITRDTVIILGPGQEADLTGLWASCIDPGLPAPAKGKIYDSGPNMVDIADWYGLESAYAMSQMAEFINDNSLQEDDNALAALWAIASGELSRENEEAAMMLYEIGLDPDNLPEPMEPFVSELMLADPGTQPFESQSIGLDVVLDPGLIDRIKFAFPLRCLDCTPCNFWALPYGPIGPIFPHCGYAFHGMTFPPFVPTNLEIQDYYPADGIPELLMSCGQVTISFPSPVSCVEITYCHYASGTFAAYRQVGPAVMTRSFAARQGVVRTVVLCGSDISFVTIIGAEISISEICVTE